MQRLRASQWCDSWAACSSLPRQYMTCCGTCSESRSTSSSMDWGQQGFKILRDDTFIVQGASEFCGWKTGYGPGCRCGGPRGSSCDGSYDGHGDAERAAYVIDENGDSSTRMSGEVTSLSDVLRSAHPGWETELRGAGGGLLAGDLLDGVSTQLWRQPTRDMSASKYNNINIEDHMYAMLEFPLGCMAMPDWAVPKCPCWLQTAYDWGESECIDFSVDPDWAVWVFHSPAFRCVRLAFTGVKRGNQCCYDASGKLITGGSGAGTADSRSQSYPVQHAVNDVVPWFFLTLSYYQKHWPIITEDCPPNTGDPSKAPPGGGSGGGGGSLPPGPGDTGRILDELRRRAREHCDSIIIPEIIEEFGNQRTPESEAAYARRFEACFEEVFNAYVGS